MARKAPAQDPAASNGITLSERLVVAFACFCIAAVTAALLVLMGRN